jgi:hypothetical protein
MEGSARVPEVTNATCPHLPHCSGTHLWHSGVHERPPPPGSELHYDRGGKGNARFSEVTTLLKKNIFQLLGKLTF